MTLSAPRALDSNHGVDNFRCGNPNLDQWLQRHARQAEGSGSAKTFVVCDGDRLAGYFSLTVGQIDTIEAPERVRRGMGRYPIPLIILARMAVDQDYQGRGVGRSLLQDAIRRAAAVAEHAGIRALLTRAIDADAEAFYRRFGFEATPGNERQLILMLKDAKRFLTATRKS